MDLPVHQELQQKYSKVKKLYFEKSAQVEQLQNTLAKQRLSQSRTSLDDNEYSTRFNRLDGAINNLSFNIRKDWKTVPLWLQPVINDDACARGTKEMTVVGRACITRWIVEEILEKYFHPDIEPVLSAQLKRIERNLREMAYPPQSIEEEDALLSRISAWRLATFDGLQDVLFQPRASEQRRQLARCLAEKLTATLQMDLNDPPPVGLEGGVTMIVELAVGLTAHLHLESRDVFVYYPLPGHIIALDKVKLETGLPPLVKGGGGADGGADSTDKTSPVGADGGSQPGEARDLVSLADMRDSDSSSLNKDQVPRAKRGVLGAFMSKRPTQGPTGGEAALPTQPSTNASQASLPLQPPGSSAGGGPPAAGGEDGEGQRVRVAAFMSVEVRGRSILVKAPVWAL